MSKSIKWIIGIVVVILIGVGCFLFGKQTAMTSSLFVEDGLVKYNNNGVTEEVLSLEELFTKEDNTTVVNGKEVEFSVQDGYIIWNYVGETKINKLIAIEELVGKQGENGVDGKDGTNGVDGKDGINGVDGKDGTNGVDGKDGTNGIDGKDGANGKDGKSAYIWVKYLDNAPESSEDSDLKDEASSYMGIYYGENSTAPADISSYKWYAVKGEKGDKGDKGDTGAQGIQGEKGDKGDKGDKGEQGIQGEKGDTGAAGKDGVDGKNGVITDMAVIQGTKTSEDIKNSSYLYLTNGTLYSTTEKIYFEDDEYIELYDAGIYLISITGNSTFTSEDGYLYMMMTLNDNQVYEDLEKNYASYKYPYLTATQLIRCPYDGNSFKIMLTTKYIEKINYTITIMRIGDYNYNY